MTDCMEQKWCCLTCSSTFRFGEIIGADTPRCPKCNSDHLHPADGCVGDLPEYFGERGTIQ